MAKKTKPTTGTSGDRPVLRTVGGDPLSGAASSDPLSGAATDEKTERLSITLTADGSAIDWDRMRPATREKLRALTGAASGDGAGLTIDPAIVGMLYGSLGSLMVGIARSRGFTQEQAGVLIFSPEEKAALEPCTAKLLAKYTGPLGKWETEITFCTMFGMVMAGKLSQLRKTAPVIGMVPRNDSAAPADDPAV